VALLRRHLRQHQPETVALLTSLPPHQLNAAQWLADNRSAWGIENPLQELKRVLLPVEETEIARS